MSAALAFDAPRTRAAELGDALRSELRLLDELQRQLLLQRAAVVRSDAAGVDESVHASGRVLVTLEEARRRRRQLCLLLFGDAELPPAEIPDRVEGAERSAVLQLVGRLISTAELVAQTIAVNRRVLQGAVRAGEDLIRVLQGAPPGGVVYDRGATAPRLATGSMINRRL